MKRVVADWPCTLQEWDRQEAEISAMANAGTTSGKPCSKLSRSVPEPVAAIAFALEFGCTEVLPAAFYTLSRIPINCDWDRARPPGESSVRLARWSMLESHNFIRFLRGCSALDSYCERQRNPYLTPLLSVDCEAKEEDSEDEDDDWFETPCRDYLAQLFDAIWTSTPLRDPLRSLKDLAEPERFRSTIKKCPEGLCWPCQGKLRRWMVAERKREWAALVGYFELGDLCQPPAL